MRTIIASLFVAAMLLPAAAQDEGSSATAKMTSADDRQAGTVTFRQTKSGMLHVIVEMTGLKPGPHGFHVHEKGQCDAAGGFESAGGHLAGGGQHGVDSADGPHAGDFPNVHVGQEGVLKAEFFTDRLSIRGGDAALLDEDGSAVIVHADPDDHATHPSGDAGDRIACGVVEQPG